MEIVSNNQQLNQQAVITKPNFFYSHRVLILGVLSVLIVIVILIPFLYFNAKKRVVSEDDLPIKLSILQNPIIYEWQGNVEGKLADKTDQNFTLEKDGKQLTITVKENYTSFRQEGELGVANLTISDVPIGALVRGTVWLSAKDKAILTKTPGDIVGGVFSFSLPEGN